MQVRQLDPVFEAAEWECADRARRRAAAASSSKRRAWPDPFAFGTLGTHRLEARVLLQNGRANGALRKLGAVQEGVLRRSIQQRGGELLRPGALVDAQRGLGRPLGLDGSPRPLMTQLPSAARCTSSAAVIAIGLTLFVGLPAGGAVRSAAALPRRCCVLSSMSASLKVYLPLTTSGSTMSVSYAVDFASLLLLGPH